MEVQVLSACDGSLFLSYAVEPAEAVILPEHSLERRDGLWRGTCFELFLMSPAGGYREFNFAPLFAWNVYAFTDWRKGMRWLDTDVEPHLVDSRLDDRKVDYPGCYELNVVLAPALVLQPARASLTAVIEERSGTKSYWALAHPPGEPNFHHPDCFVAELPPPEPA